MHIRELHLKEPITISPFQSTDDAIQLMWQHDIRHLPVVDRQGLCGLLTDGDLLESVGMLTLEERRELGDPCLSEPVIVADVMDPEAPSVTPETAVVDAGSRMLYEKRSAVSVVDSGRVVGIVSELDIVRLFTNTCRREHGTPRHDAVLNHGSRVLKTVAPEDSVQTVCAKLSSGKFRHLPVVEGDRLVGMVSDWDIRAAIGRSGIGSWLSMTVSELMATGVPVLRPNDSLGRAAEIICQEKATALPITTRDGLLVSLLTISDLLNAFVSGAAIHA